MSKRAKNGVPSKEVLQAMQDWNFANGQYIRAKGPTEKEHWRQLMVKAGEKLR